MSKTMLKFTIKKELDKINDRIDRKIIKGHSFDLEARRHKELLAILDRAERESQRGRKAIRRLLWPIKSPVRRSLNGGAFARLLRLRAA